MNSYSEVEQNLFIKKKEYNTHFHGTVTNRKYAEHVDGGGNWRCSRFQTTFVFILCSLDIPPWRTRYLVCLGHFHLKTKSRKSSQARRQFTARCWLESKTSAARCCCWRLWLLPLSWVAKLFSSPRHTFNISHRSSRNVPLSSTLRA